MAPGIEPTISPSIVRDVKSSGDRIRPQSAADTTTSFYDVFVTWFVVWPSPGSREQAFVYALASASLAQSVSKACSAGISVRCSCGPLPKDAMPPPPPVDLSNDDEDTKTHFQWGGCSDDFNFGLEYSQQFVEAAYVSGGGKRRTKSRKMTKQILMNKHNYLVGRRVRTQ